MAYGVKVGIKAKDIYDRLTPAEKERFEEIIISNVDKTEDEVITEKRVAREILSMIEEICFSKKFSEYRINNGSNGQRDLIIMNIKEKYGIE